ncbi:MAG: hypothetical protein IT323_13620 [Anaerolineae bacterium]|nr:hypothetical protein [Anaerolineae bacterium]
MDKVLRVTSVAIIIFAAVIAFVVGSRIDPRTVSLLSGTVIGILVAAPCATIITWVLTHRGDITAALARVSQPVQPPPLPAPIIINLNDFRVTVQPGTSRDVILSKAMQQGLTFENAQRVADVYARAVLDAPVAPVVPAHGQRWRDEGHEMGVQLEAVTQSSMSELGRIVEQVVNACGKIVTVQGGTYAQGGAGFVLCLQPGVKIRDVKAKHAILCKLFPRAAHLTLSQSGTHVVLRVHGDLTLAHTGCDNNRVR